MQKRNCLLIAFGLLCMALVVAGCSAGSQDEQGTGSGAGAVAGFWTLRSLIAEGQRAALLAGSPITADFDDGSLSGSGGCNGYNADYELNDGAITIGPVARTERFCASEGVMDQEVLFFSVLEQVSNVQVETDELLLSSADGQAELLFVRADATGASTEQVSWEEALEILSSGQVEMAAQSHSREVQLLMKDGRTIYTIEPGLDDIFQAVKDCGDPCSDIALATE